jgi:hypothetical protein
MAQARVQRDGRHIGHHVQHDIDRGKDHRRRLHHRQVAFGYGINHEPAEPVVIEDRLDQHDARDQIGQVEGHHVDDRRQRVGGGMAKHHAAVLHALQEGGFDIGLVHHRKNGGAGHAHDLRHGDEHQHQHRQGGGLQPGRKAHPGPGIGEARQQPVLHRDEQDQQQAEEIFGQRDRGQRHHIRHPVEERAAERGRGDAEAHRQRHRDHRGIASKRHRIPEPRPEQVSHRLAVREGLAQISLDDARGPAEVARDRPRVQPELLAQRGERFRRGILPEDRRGDIAGQELRAGKYQHGDQGEGHDPQPQTLHNEPPHQPSQTFSARRAPIRLNIGCGVTPFTFFDTPSR